MRTVLALGDDEDEDSLTIRLEDDPSCRRMIIANGITDVVVRRLDVFRNMLIGVGGLLHNEGSSGQAYSAVAWSPGVRVLQVLSNPDYDEVDLDDIAWERTYHSLTPDQHALLVGALGGATDFAPF